MFALTRTRSRANSCAIQLCGEFSAWRAVSLGQRKLNSLAERNSRAPAKVLRKRNIGYATRRRRLLSGISHNSRRIADNLGHRFCQDKKIRADARTDLDGNAARKMIQSVDDRVRQVLDVDPVTHLTATPDEKRVFATTC